MDTRASATIAIVALVALSGCFGVLGPSDNGTSTPTPPQVTDYYNKSTLDSGIIDQQTDLLKYHNGFKSQVTIRVSPVNSNTSAQQVTTYTYTSNYTSGQWMSKKHVNGHLARVIYENENSTYIRTGNNGTYSYDAEARPTTSIQSIKRSLAKGIALFKPGEMNLTKVSSNEQVAVFKSQNFAWVNVPSVNDEESASVTRSTARVYVNKSGLITGVQLDIRFTSQDGTKYKSTAVFELISLGPENITEPRWTLYAFPYSGTRCAPNTEVTLTASKRSDGPGYTGTVSLDSIGSAQQVVIKSSDGRIGTLTYTGEEVGFFAFEGDTITVIAKEESCTRTIETRTFNGTGT